jgi:hypothetical protein
VSGDQWIALAGVSSGAIVGIGSLLFAYFNGKAERAHGERLARSGRLHEQRRAAYVEISRLLERQRLFLVRTEPFLGPKPAPPPPLNDEDWSAVSGQAAVSPSQEVRSLLSEAAERTTKFEYAVHDYRQEEARPRAAPDEAGKSPRQTMDEARDRALKSITAAQERMRKELEGL